MKKLLSLVMVVAFVAILFGGIAGCVTDQARLWQSADPMSKAVFFNEVYSEQWDEYLVVIAVSIDRMPDEVEAMTKTEAGRVELQELAKNSNLSEEARTALRAKKSLLQKVEEPIDTFTDLAKIGISPSPEQEKFIIDLLNQLKYRAYMNK